MMIFDKNGKLVSSENGATTWEEFFKVTFKKFKKSKHANQYDGVSVDCYVVPRAQYDRLLDPIEWISRRLKATEERGEDSGWI